MTVCDQAARDMANRALNAVSSHERVCAERQGHIMQGLSDIKEDVKALFARFWVASISLITILISICGSLLYLILNKPH